MGKSRLCPAKIKSRHLHWQVFFIAKSAAIFFHRGISDASSDIASRRRRPLRRRASSEVRRRALTRSSDPVLRAAQDRHRIDDAALLHQHADRIERSRLSAILEYDLKHRL